MKTMTDSNGQTVPLKYVCAYDRERDAATRRILARFRKQRAALEALVVECLADLDTLRAKSGEAGGDRGNYQISSFDGLITVAVRQTYRIQLDERVERARELMLDYARRLAGRVEGTDGAALLQIIGAAFEAGRNGALPYAKVLALLRLNIAAPQWVEAKQLLADSIKPERGKAYLACYVRPDRQRDAVPIRLDIADCWPQQKPEE